MLIEFQDKLKNISVSQLLLLCDYYKPTFKTTKTQQFGVKLIQENISPSSPLTSELS